MRWFIGVNSIYSNLADRIFVFFSVFYGFPKLPVVIRTKIADKLFKNRNVLLRTLLSSLEMKWMNQCDSHTHSRWTFLKMTVIHTSMYDEYNLDHIILCDPFAIGNRYFTHRFSLVSICLNLAFFCGILCVCARSFIRICIKMSRLPFNLLDISITP